MARATFTSEVRDVVERVRSSARRSHWSAFPATIAATALLIVLHTLRWSTATRPWLDTIASVRQTDALSVVLARTPLSLLAPAPHLPVWGALAQVLIVGVIAEAVLGSRHTIAVALGTQLTANLLTHAAVVTGHGPWMGLAADHLSDRDTGPSVAVVVLALVCALELRAIVLGSLVAIGITIEAIVLPDVAGHEHLFALVFAPLTWFVLRQAQVHRCERSRRATPVTSDQAAETYRQRRRARRVAAAATAGSGLIALVSALTAPDSRRIRRIDDVLSLGTAHAATGAVAAAGVALLVLSRAILRGQRRAHLATCLLLAGAVLGHLLKGADVEEATLASLGLAYLVHHRSAFQAGTTPRALRHALRTTLVGLAVTFTAGFIAVEALAAYTDQHHALPVRRAATDVVGSIRNARPNTVPVNHFLHAALFGMAAGVALLALRRSLRPMLVADQLRRERSNDEARARAIVARHGAGTLDWFVLRDDKNLFIHGETAIGYTVRFGICLVSPDPVGPANERQHAFEAFHRFADLQGWRVAVLGAAEDELGLYRAYGMRSVYVGDEAIVDVPGFSLEGGARKSLRQAVNRVERNGYHVSFHDPSSIDQTLRSALVSLMTRSRRGGLERGFSMTLGRAFEARDEGLLLAICRDRADVPVAFCQFVPSPAIGGWSLDLMRRDTGEHPNGLIDFVIVQTIRHLSERGDSAVSLNFATLRRLLADADSSGPLQRVQRWMLLRLSDEMQIASLWTFTSKYGPRWAPRFVVFDGAESAVHVGLAMAAAESWWELPVIGRWFGGKQEEDEPMSGRGAVIEAHT